MALSEKNRHDLGYALLGLFGDFNLITQLLLEPTINKVLNSFSLIIEILY